MRLTKTHKVCTTIASLYQLGAHTQPLIALLFHTLTEKCEQSPQQPWHTKHHREEHDHRPEPEREGGRGGRGGGIVGGRGGRGGGRGGGREEVKEEIACSIQTSVHPLSVCPYVHPSISSFPPIRTYFPVRQNQPQLSPELPPPTAPPAGEEVVTATRTETTIYINSTVNHPARWQVS